MGLIFSLSPLGSEFLHEAALFLGHIGSLWCHVPDNSSFQYCEPECLATISQVKKKKQAFKKVVQVVCMSSAAEAFTAYMFRLFFFFLAWVETYFQETEFHPFRKTVEIESQACLSCLYKSLRTHDSGQT